MLSYLKVPKETSNPCRITVRNIHLSIHHARELLAQKVQVLDAWIYDTINWWQGTGLGEYANIILIRLFHSSILD